MGGGVLLLIIILIIWAVTTAKENIEAAQFKEETKGMSHDEMMWHSHRRYMAKQGVDVGSHQKHKAFLERQEREEDERAKKEIERQLEEHKKKIGFKL